MMQPMRIDGKAPKGGPNLSKRHLGHGRVRDTATLDRHRQAAPGRTRAEPLDFACVSGSSAHCVEPHTLRDLAGCGQAPQHDQQLAGECDDHRLPGGAAAVLGALLEPLGERAVRLMLQKPTGELDQRPPHAGIAGLGEPFLAAPAAAFIGGAGDTNITGYRAAIAPISRQRLEHQQLGGPDADAADTGEQ
jgi:hypothetical protein